MIGVIPYLMCAVEVSSAACVRIDSKNRVPLPSHHTQSPQTWYFIGNTAINNWSSYSLTQRLGQGSLNSFTHFTPDESAPSNHGASRLFLAQYPSTIRRGYSGG